MSRLRLTLACWDYDRVRALQDGRVRPEGIDLTILPLPVEETFYRQLRYHEFDVSEMSLSSYLLTMNAENPPFVAVPVFPSRSFRHQSMYVNTRSGIESPADLIGRRVGCPEYQLTAAVWQRGLLADDYGVETPAMRYFTGAVEESGRTEKLALDLPPEIDVTPIGPDQNLSTMLADGEIDALLSAGRPSSFGRSPNVVRLFPDFVAVEQEWFTRTRVFPIMHVLVIRRDVFDASPWIGRSLYKAFDAALRIASADLGHRNALKVMLPWLEQHVAETVAVLGDGYWDYGLEPNRPALELFARYSHEQGLAARRYRPEEIVLSQADDRFRL